MEVYGYSITYKSQHQIDDIYFSKNGVRTIPVMTSALYGGCIISQSDDACPDGIHSPWDDSDNTGCSDFTMHQIICDHDIASDRIHIHFGSEADASTSGYTVTALDETGVEMEVVLDINSRSGVDSEEYLLLPYIFPRTLLRWLSC